jgi:hypothetical protein
VILKIVPKTGYEMYTGENRLRAAKESKNRNSDAASEQSLELVGNFF